MTREEKQKAIDALKTSAPVMVVTQEEFNDYIKTLNKIMDWLEQEPCEVEAAQLQQVYIKGFEDCRQAVLASIKNLYPDMPVVDIFGARRKWLEKYAPYFECENAVEQLPPVTPQPKIIKESDT